MEHFTHNNDACYKNLQRLKILHTCIEGIISYVSGTKWNGTFYYQIIVMII